MKNDKIFLWGLILLALALMACQPATKPEASTAKTEPTDTWWSKTQTTAPDKEAYILVQVVPIPKGMKILYTNDDSLIVWTGELVGDYYTERHAIPLKHYTGLMPSGVTARGDTAWVGMERK